MIRNVRNMIRHDGKMIRHVREMIRHAGRLVCHAVRMIRHAKNDSSRGKNYSQWKNN